MRIVTVVAALCFALGLSAQEYSWEAVKMDGSRAGCRYAMQEDKDEAIGTIVKGVYTAPNGTVFKKNSVTSKVAALVLDAQPAMSEKKQIIGHSDHELRKGRRGSELCNLIVDLMMAEAAAQTGKPVHVGILNLGGIRADLPAGNILLDDVESMLPFSNNIVYIEHKGSQLRQVLEDMSPRRFQAFGGITVVLKDDKIESIEVGGEPLDDEKVYGVASITFLLDGGDDIFLAPNALRIDTLSVMVRQPVLDHIIGETAAGRKIGYKKDSRVIRR